MARHHGHLCNNAGLIERGNVTVWMNERMFSPASQMPGQRGRPQASSNGMIQMLLTIKSVYRLSLRALQGFATSLQRLAMADLYLSVCCCESATTCGRVGAFPANPLTATQPRL